VTPRQECEASGTGVHLLVEEGVDHDEHDRSGGEAEPGP